MSNRAPTGFYGATNRPTHRARRLAAPMTESLLTVHETDWTYQPNEGLFERKDFVLGMYPSDHDDPGDRGF